jgi:hypothetical protein
MKEKKPIWLYIIFPAVSMLLGWGLRGYIGGGPFGAMIPGAMVALCIAFLLDLPVELASVLAVFGAIGIGLGGEMTYGQTLGFLKNPETVWWGTLGTTVKGSIWGLLGGIIIAMGLLYKRLPKKTIIIAFLLLLAGMIAGFKLINQPMVIYFSDRSNPRPESWAALLFGAIAILFYLRKKIDSPGFRIVSRYALWGFISGGLGFGLGGFWMVLGFQLPSDVIFNSWWKAMEFSFGLLLGAGMGYATWLSRKKLLYEKTPLSAPKESYSIIKELVVTLITGLLIFWFFAFCFDAYVEAGRNIHGFTMIGPRDFAKILSNYAFLGLLMVLIIMRFPSSAWQIAVTLTFSHTVIDLVDDIYPKTLSDSPLTLPFIIVIISTLIVAILAAWLQRRKNVIRNMFLLLTWTCMIVAFIRLTLNPDVFNLSGISPVGFVFGRFFVHIVFLVSACYISLIMFKMSKRNEPS